MADWQCVGLRRLFALLLVGALAGITGAARADENCPAPEAWFKASGTPVPPTSEPKRGDDCAFYQRAWQTFLYSTDTKGGQPRFLAPPYKSYLQVFGTDEPAGLALPAASKTLVATSRMLVLAPRNMEVARVTEAEDIQQAGSKAILIDQNGRPIFYNIIMNPEFVDFIKKNNYTDIQKLRAAPATQELPVGAVEYKAAWQIIDSAADADHRISLPALVPWLISDGNGKLKIDSSRALRQVTVALIGLHVVFRPVGHPEMIWATFEYNRNAPSLKGNPNMVVVQPTPDHPSPNDNNTCMDSNEPHDETVFDDGKPYLLYGNGTPYANTNSKPDSLSVVDDAKQTFSPKSNIVRAFPFSGCFPGQNGDHAITEIDQAVSSLNKNVLGNLTKDDRRVYSLVGAVWLDEPNNPNSDLAFKENESFDDFQLGGENRLSSTSMESMTQTTNPNCFSCHITGGQGNLPAKRINISHIFSRFGK
jgi:hypothetical protein